MSSKEELSELGINSVIYGIVRSGKTTLMKEVFNEFRNLPKVGEGHLLKHKKILLPFPMYVLATKKIIEENEWDKFPVRYKSVAITGKRFYYFFKSIQGSAVLIEDFPTMFKDRSVWGRKADWTPINNFLSAVRHYNSMFFMTGQSFEDYIHFVPRYVLAKFTYIIIFRTPETLFRLMKINIPRRTCVFLDNAVKNLPRYNFIALDIRRKMLLKPTDSRDASRLLRFFSEKEDEEEVWDMQSYWYGITSGKRGGGRKPKPKDAPLYGGHQVIVDTLNADSNTNLKDLAETLGITLASLYVTICRLRKAGKLPNYKPKAGRKRR